VSVFRILAVLAVLTGVGAAQDAPRDAFAEGVAAYRRADHERAIEIWRPLLEQDLAPLDRARVYYDLGNAAWRRERPYEAIACYTAAVRLDPRHADAWANLEFARAKAGLPPADAGDLGATLRRALDSFRPDERRGLLFGALVLWTLLLVVEMRLGGRALRRALAVGGLMVALAAVPWAWEHLRPTLADPLLVVDAGSVALRAEPLESRPATGQLEVLEEVERIDALPGWVRIRRADGQRGWVREGALFALVID
jgi:tetratricopeptide (TPR) repeat protein